MAKNKSSKAFPSAGTVLAYTLKGGSVFVVILAVLLYRRNAEADLKQDVLTGLLRAERKVPPNPEVRVAVGFGACQDVIADGLQTLHKLDARPPAEPAHFDEILDQQELEKVFAYFFRHGAAAE